MTPYEQECVLVNARHALAAAKKMSDWRDKLFCIMCGVTFLVELELALAEEKKN